MTESNEQLWTVSEADLTGLDGVRARDLMVECFLQAQSATFRRTASALNIDSDETELRKTVASAVTLKFKDLGCDYDNPTSDDISRVADALEAEARAWGTPDDVVQHHRAQMREICDRLDS